MILDPKEFRTLLKFRKEMNQLTIKKVVVGCSGCADSVALLLMLHYMNMLLLKPSERYDIICVYVDHSLRDVEDEIKFVKELCELLRVTFITKKVDTTVYKNNIESDARTARYTLLSEVGGYFGAPFTILTGHHRRDQAETVLMSIFGMYHNKKGHIGCIKKYNPELNVFRPMLTLSREEIDYFVRNFTVIQDPTNVDTIYKRNLIRLVVLPWLKENVNKNIESVLASRAVC
jgi:tRNA(Ile)-lysidine synthase